MPRPRDDSSPRDADLDAERDPERWAAAAIAQLLEVWRRRGRSYARRLERQHRIRDAARDLLTLAARRVLPLQRPLTRLLPPEVPDVERRAFGALAAVDRAVLLRREQARGPAERAHLAAACLRLTLKAQAVRRQADAPPGAGPEPGEKASARQESVAIDSSQHSAAIASHSVASASHSAARASQSAFSASRAGSAKAEAPSTS